MKNRIVWMASVLMVITAFIITVPAEGQTQKYSKVVKKQKKRTQPKSADESKPANRLDSILLKFESEKAVCKPAKDIRQTPEESDDDALIYESVDRPPVFPGGEASLARWIKGHINYPHDAEANGVQGIVTVQFEVTATGSIGQVKILRGKSPELDKEAMRVIKSLPKFTPGKINGHAVNCWYKFPVEFRL